MEDSILLSTKMMLGIAPTYTVFDEEIIFNINSVLSTLYQLGIDIETIEDDSSAWSDLLLPANQINMVKTYIFLKVKMVFDPPNTSYLVDAAQKQIAEQEWRLSEFVNVTF
jgi:hypothetical protein